MGFSMIGLILLVVVVGGAIFGITALITSIKGIRLGHATLNCPACQKETPANAGQCKHCGHPFA